MVTCDGSNYKFCICLQFLDSYTKWLSFKDQPDQKFWSSLVTNSKITKNKVLIRKYLSKMGLPHVEFTDLGWARVVFSRGVHWSKLGKGGFGFTWQLYFIWWDFKWFSTFLFKYRMKTCIFSWLNTIWLHENICIYCHEWVFKMSPCWIFFLIWSIWILGLHLSRKNYNKWEQIKQISVYFITLKYYWFSFHVLTSWFYFIIWTIPRWSVLCNSCRW